MHPPDSLPRNNVAMALASGLYSGFSPFAPGTMGSLVGLAFFFIPGFSSPAVLLIVIHVAFFAGVVVASRFSTASTPDPSFVVIDELAGMWISMFLLPLTPLALISSFLGFRLFDIFKPYPCRQLERLPSGWGIMLDDVAAAVYANLATRIILAIF